VVVCALGRRRLTVAVAQRVHVSDSVRHLPHHIGRVSLWHRIVARLVVQVSAMAELRTHHRANPHHRLNRRQPLAAAQGAERGEMGRRASSQGLNGREASSFFATAYLQDDTPLRVALADLHQGDDIWVLDRSERFDLCARGGAVSDSVRETLSCTRFPTLVPIEHPCARTLTIVHNRAVLVCNCYLLDRIPPLGLVVLSLNHVAIAASPEQMDLRKRFLEVAGRLCCQRLRLQAAHRLKLHGGMMLHMLLAFRDGLAGS